LDGLAGIGVRGEVAEAEFDFVSGGVGFHLEDSRRHRAGGYG
jgi:hypothetical protein